MEKVEILAPAGTKEALKAGIEAGANAVYLGGKHFNMRVHNDKYNFGEEEMKEAIEYAHERGVKVYVTMNNLISEEELPQLREYLKYIESIKADAILVQDMAVIKIMEEEGIEIPIHASIMMNVHNEKGIRLLKEKGIKRVVVSREFSLKEVELLKERTGIETEYFIHGDMCIAESGQCIHSGVVFGQSGNRGRCMKPCRWKYSLNIDSAEYGEEEEGLMAESCNRLALNDMCMYRNLPEMINAGISSFKIEGRMREAKYIKGIVKAYREAIDRYMEDPTGYEINEEEWEKLYEGRVRDYTTNLAMGESTAEDIGWSGEREPKIFSKAVKEAEVTDKNAKKIFEEAEAIKGEGNQKLSVRVKNVAGAKVALNNGADILYIGAESFKPLKPITMKEYIEVIEYAHTRGKKVILNTPRTTYEREMKETEELIEKMKKQKDTFDGVMVGNIGTLEMMKGKGLPIQTDFYLNIFNHKAVEMLKEEGVSKVGASLELSYGQLKAMVEKASLPIEVLIHGAYESMIIDHNLINLEYDLNKWNENNWYKDKYVLKDDAGERHSLRIDQYGRNHIYFAKDMCLYEYLDKFKGVDTLRIEGQMYDEETLGYIVRAYKEAIEGGVKEGVIEEMQKKSPRPLGIGVYRYKESMDS